MDSVFPHLEIERDNEVVIARLLVCPNCWVFQRIESMTIDCIGRSTNCYHTRQSWKLT